MTPELLDIIQARKRLYKLLKQPGADRATLFRQYRRLRTSGNNLYRQLRNAHFQSSCHRYSRDPKRLWEVIKTVSGKSKSKLRPLPPPDTLNSFFASLVSDCSMSHATPYGPANEQHFIAFNPVSPSSMQKLLEQLDTGKAPGSDELLPSLFHSCADMLAPSLAHLVNKSLSSGVVPAGFKNANITPLLKSAKLDATQPCNYRGISLLPVASKVLEKVVEEQLVSFLEEHKGLSDHQFGFRHGRSAEDLLCKAVSDWSSNKDAGLTTVVAFIDLSKAFDRISHQELLVTLQESGIGGVALQ